MNKGELIAALAERHGLKQEEAAGFIEQFFGAIMGALAADGRVEIRGFGSFKMKEYKGYTGRTLSLALRSGSSPRDYHASGWGRSLRTSSMSKLWLAATRNP